MKHTIKNPLVIETAYNEDGDVYTKGTTEFRKAEFVSKEVAQELAEALKIQNELIKGELLTYKQFKPDNDIEEIHKQACEEAVQKAEQAIKNAES